jgi:hypothetical protein
MFWLATNKLRNKTFPGRVGVGGWGLWVGGLSDIKTTQPQVELEAWTELGNKFVVKFFVSDLPAS